MTTWAELLLPCPLPIASAVLDGSGLQDALAAEGLTAARGWPHADSADALRPIAEHGGCEGTFLIVLEGQVVGECGWLGGPDGSGDAEIGYGVAGPVRRRGLGTRAVGALVQWVAAQPGVRRVTADVLVGNEPSRRLLERLGFQLDAVAPPYVRYVREVPTWTRSGP